MGLQGLVSKLVTEGGDVPVAKPESPSTHKAQPGLVCSSQRSIGGGLKRWDSGTGSR